MTLSIDARGLVIDGVREGIADGSLSLGAAVRRLRVSAAGMQQEPFARMCKISVRTLLQIEQGVGNPTLKSSSRLVCRWAWSSAPARSASAN